MKGKVVTASLLSALHSLLCRQLTESIKGSVDFCLMVEKDPKEVLGSATLVPALVVAEASKQLSLGFKVSLSD